MELILPVREGFLERLNLSRYKSGQKLATFLRRRAQGSRTECHGFKGSESSVETKMKRVA